MLRSIYSINSIPSDGYVYYCINSKGTSLHINLNVYYVEEDGKCALFICGYRVNTQSRVFDGIDSDSFSCFEEFRSHVIERCDLIFGRRVILCSDT